MCPSLRRWWLVSYSEYSQHLSATGLYPEEDEASSNAPILNFNSHFNIFFPSTLSSPQWSASFFFSCENVLCAFSRPWYVHSPCHPPSLDISNNIWQAAQTTSSSLWNIHQPSLTSSLLCPNILLSTLFTNPPSPYCLYVKNQVSRQYKTTGQTTVLYVLISML
jgi:hypothetical protein